MLPTTRAPLALSVALAPTATVPLTVVPSRTQVAPLGMRTLSRVRAPTVPRQAYSSAATGVAVIPDATVRKSTRAIPQIAFIPVLLKVCRSFQSHPIPAEHGGDRVSRSRCGTAVRS
jgi:hypothetical protein